MIANIGPASMNYEETIITLRYAYRAKSIKNSPVKNEDVKEGKLLVLQQEIERLKMLIIEKSNGEVSTGVEDADEEFSDLDDESDKEEKEKKLELGKMEVDELAKKLKTLEKQMVHGGKNIVDSVNENEMRLEQQRAEIAARKVSWIFERKFGYSFGSLETNNGETFKTNDKYFFIMYRYLK